MGMLPIGEPFVRLSAPVPAAALNCIAYEALSVCGPNKWASGGIAAAEEDVVYTKGSILHDYLPNVLMDRPSSASTSYSETPSGQ